MGPKITIEQAPAFERAVKRLKRNQKADLDEAVRAVANDPSIGVAKKGDLSGIQVYKFRMVNQETLLAYEFFGNELLLYLLKVGPHENFYRDLKR